MTEEKGFSGQLGEKRLAALMKDAVLICEMLDGNNSNQFFTRVILAKPADVRETMELAEKLYPKTSMQEFFRNPLEVKKELSEMSIEEAGQIRFDLEAFQINDFAAATQFYDRFKGTVKAEFTLNNFSSEIAFPRTSQETARRTFDEMGSTGPEEVDKIMRAAREALGRSRGGIQ